MSTNTEWVPPLWFTNWWAEKFTIWAETVNTMKEDINAIKEDINDIKNVLLPASMDFFHEFPVLRQQVSKGIQGTRAPTWTMMRLSKTINMGLSITQALPSLVPLFHGTGTIL
jgi:hypothetical protein